MANEIATNNKVAPVSQPQGKLAVAAAKIADLYIDEVAKLNMAVGVPLNEEAKRCGTNVILQLCGELGAEGVQRIRKEQLIQILQFVTINGLDVFSGQVFLDKRKDKQGNIATIKATPQGNAYEIMTMRYGVNVKTLHPARIVHEGDEFILPQFDGLKMTNVVLKPTLKGLDSKAIAVYYIIEKLDGTLDFAIATREGVAKNLMAQILNASLKDGSVNRAELMKRLDGKTLDELLSDSYLAQWISPSYRSPASREQMIITKMKKNALLHYTRDLGSRTFDQVTAKALDDAENADMLSNVVDVQDPEAEKPTTKVQDFEVEEGEGEIPSPDPEPTEVKEAAVEEKPVEKPKEEKPAEQISVFDVDDL